MAEQRDMPTLLTKLAGGLATIVAAAGVLTTPAQAADLLDPGAKYIHGDVLTIGVSGAPTRDGSIAVRFANSPLPLFWGRTGMNDLKDESAMALGVHTGGVTYAGVDPTYASTQFAQLSAPSVSGSGTALDPWRVESIFRAGSEVGIMQRVTHVDGTDRFSLEWDMVAQGMSDVPVKVFFGGDTEIPFLPSNISTLTGASPNRVLANVGPDGTRVALREQSSWGHKPWDHYFAGPNAQFGASTRTNSGVDYTDIVTASSTDAGLGVQWNTTLISGAPAQTFAVDVEIAAAPVTVPPALAGDLPAEDAFTNATTVTPAFAKGTGDVVSLSFECRLDGAAWAPCTSPRSYPTLAEGQHSFSVRGVNTANLAGATTTRSWVVDTTAPGAPTLGDRPAARTKTASASFSFTGEKGATFTCSLDGGAFTPCTSPYALSALADGEHTVAVKQTDRAGNTGALDSHTWTVDTSVPPPAVTPPCTSKRSIDLSFKVPGRLKSSRFIVTVAGKRVATLKRGARKARVSLVGRPAGTYKVQVKATGKRGKVLASRSFRTCTPGR